MNNKLKIIIKFVGVFISLILLIALYVVFIHFNNAVIEEQNTPVHITPPIEKIAPKQITPVSKPVIKKPITRDENNMPKSDYKVPEIG